MGREGLMSFNAAWKYLALTKTSKANAPRDLHYLHELGVLLQTVAGLLYRKIFLDQRTVISRKTCKARRNAYFYSVVFLFFQMKTIVLKNGYFGKKPSIELEFPFDFKLKELVKTYPGCQ